MSLLFYKFFANIAALFKGRNLLWQISAIILTSVFVLSGFDWWYFTATRFVPHFAWLPAAALGGLLPIIVPLIYLAIGFIRKNKSSLNLGFALGQAGILGLLFSFAYKSVTGRLQPDLVNSLIDVSHNFRFGFMRGGVFWGWPSSHTTVAFATALTLIYLYPKNKVLKYIMLIYAFYIGLAVSTSIHWFSEFVAGAIFGSLVGVLVGTNFRKRINSLIE
ncbi:MAG: phosphatase PAP2 family protein [Candidatus Falkowbacteria bacterium]|nr:phosphatase PAP2 family protein [Candidatus Falkowbacteria bacterium]